MEESQALNNLRWTYIYRVDYTTQLSIIVYNKDRLLIE